jgi:hypothetical protein
MVLFAHPLAITWNGAEFVRIPSVVYSILHENTVNNARNSYKLNSKTRYINHHIK